MSDIYQKFQLTSKTVVITGGCGLLGQKHAETVVQTGGTPILLDINPAVVEYAKKIKQKYKSEVIGYECDITDKKRIMSVMKDILKQLKKVDVLINNAANNPKVENDSLSAGRFENFSLDKWQQDFAVGLTGAIICCQVFGKFMAVKKKGVILNIASDLGVIAPDQRIYRKKGMIDKLQPVKPFTYSVIKHGIIGLTKYLATYWADQGIRVNTLSPGGVYNNQPQEFVNKLNQLIPIGRMAHQDEYCAAVLFLISDASSYMTGANLIIDGGRTVW